MKKLSQKKIEALRNSVPEKESDTRKVVLRLRWEAAPDNFSFSGKNWLCHYELVIPLQRWDRRREDEDGVPHRDELVVPLNSPCVRAADREPCRLDDGTYWFDTPYRDGAHAYWDAKLLGDPEVLCIAIDGTIIRKTDEAEQL
ncbi:hypothetical protein [Agrobacterium larrymoorei]|uniref:Uncharacterized protein n=1 Tax=Agrobacterium larrymoorei TaxID=160699 RepID=A0ABU0ULX0_9HYPH|nr:hypothetical protein [Agrobacterium larrymoorei]MDQ1185955.1 hypothetical protein [Agrobacterium larrymoorei]